MAKDLIKQRQMIDFENIFVVQRTMGQSIINSTGWGTPACQALFQRLGHESEQNSPFLPSVPGPPERLGVAQS